MPIKFKHCFKKLPPKKIRSRSYNWYQFYIWIEESENILQKINYVEYELHKSFPDPTRIIGQEKSNKKFYLNVHAISAFGINITVRFKDGIEDQQLYFLNLDDECSEDFSINALAL